jgi:PKHD-type hydroxylase
MDGPWANDSVASVGVFPGTLTERECRDIRALAASWREEAVGIEPAPSKPIRRATTRYVARGPETEWIFARMKQAFVAANQIFEFAIDDDVEQILFVTYGADDFLDWHTDLGSGEESTRKLSMSIMLHGPDDYDGGGLQVVSMEQPIDDRRAGSAIVFPAHLAHRVLPVTRGQRDVLVAWMHGPSFR